jgi:hypothetical protein
MENKVDSVVEQVKNNFDSRSRTGIEKYGTTLDRDDLTFIQWLTHLQEELMDATLYLEKLKSEMENDNRYVITKESWESAEKITHEGFVYVKFNDLKRI